jgi:putative N6-adenine-specific DNA methylase
MKYTIVVKTLFGLEEILTDELSRIGITQVTKLRRAVQFEGSLLDIYNCNLHLRTALSVLVKVSIGSVSNENELYQYIKSIKWDEYFELSNTIAVSVVSVSKQMTHSLFLEQKTKDAVVDYFRDKYGERPDVDVKNPDVKISIYQTDDSCSVYLDSSGKPLYFRGFNKEIGEASINECLAAGIIYISGWNKKDEFIDPMCGSGTFLSEAYMMACNIPSTLQRKGFSFKNWINFDSAIWEEILNKAQSQITEIEASISGFDINPEAVLLARNNMYKVDKNNSVRVTPADFFELNAPSESGIIVSNPPYGTRIRLDDSNEFYKRIGNKLKFGFQGYTAWIISSDLTAIKFIGMKPDKKLVLFNGQLECRLHKFSIYKGKKKDLYK